MNGPDGTAVHLATAWEATVTVRHWPDWAHAAGYSVGLRARHDSDVLTLHAGLYDDVETRARADSRPWQPIPPDPEVSPYRVREQGDDVAVFSVVDLEEGEAMVRAATRAGFVPEGVRRDAAWVSGRFVDEAVLALLADERRPEDLSDGHRGSPSSG